MISTVIVTLNEALDLPGCLDSLSWCDDVHVLDSFSSDDTTRVAAERGAHVSQRRFDGYASHRNAGLALPGIKHPWVLVLDGDERTPPACGQQLLNAAATADPEVGAFRLRRRDFFMGRWLRHAQISPFTIRLLRRGSTCYEREVNEAVKVEGRIVDLSEPFDHFPFSKGMSRWLEKHNRYSSMEAQIIADSRGRPGHGSLRGAFFATDFNERRMHQKQIFYRLPCRPTIKLLYMLFYRGAILDGKPGIAYSFLQAYYEFLIVLKTEELKGRPSPSSASAPSPQPSTRAKAHESPAPTL